MFFELQVQTFPDVGAEETVDERPNTDQLALTHEEKIQQLEEHNEYLRNRLIDQSGEHQMQIYDKDFEMELLQEENAALRSVVSGVGKIFRPDQLHRLQHPGTRAEWSKKTLQEAIALRTLCGSTAYNYMYSKGHPLPHINTLRNHLRKIECQPGVLNDFIDLTELKIATMPVRDKYCALVIDKMTIKSKYVFNNHTQSFMGNPTMPLTENLVATRLAEDPTWDQAEALATHAMNAMVAGLCGRYKVLVGK